MSTTARQVYRPEIDGLRTIAVAAVVVYHLKITVGDVALLRGGFLGVDLFFVLSGFLIAGILFDEFRDTGRISIAQFYWRRAKRILPPLLLVIAASLPAAWIILLPSEMERFAWSVLAALGFVSNAFWYVELSEYGAQSGLLQPFLHTWSLAIEEQFYIVFPPLVILLLRRGTLAWALRVLLALTAVGLAAAMVLTHLSPEASFYSPTSRAWEMLAGVVLAALARLRPAGPAMGRLGRAVPSVALAVLAASFAAADLAYLDHPGLATVPTIAATCALLWFARPDEPVTRLLSTRPMVWIGKLSYSIYLWHFPIFAFGRMLGDGVPGAGEMAVWVALTLALSWLGYRLVERPFRFAMAPRPFAVATLAALVPIVAVCVAALSGARDGGARTEALAALYGGVEVDNAVLAREAWSLLDARAPDEEIGPWNALRPSETEMSDLWFRADADVNVLVVGDSLARDVWNALVLNRDAFGEVDFARFNLHRRSLEADLARLRASPNYAAADVVLIAPNYYREFRTALAAMLDALQAPDKRIAIVGAPAHFSAGGAQPLYDWHLRRSGTRDALADLGALAPRYENPRTRARDAEIRRIAAARGVPYLSRRDLVCPDDTCTLVTDGGGKTMYDGIHWTLEGAALFGRRAAETGWLDPVLADDSAALR